MIEIKNVTKTFCKAGSTDELLALTDVSLKIEAGKIFVVLGPSGCGKSTLLSIIAGFESPSLGTVAVGGTPITRPGPDRGVVFQEFALFPWRTVRGNVEVGPLVRGIDRPRVRERCQYYLNLVGLQNFEERYPAELSGGMKQRVGLARALANEPSVLLMDEPFGALDAQTRLLMQKELLRIWEVTKTTIVFVTHDVTEAILLADKIALMTARPGRIKEILDVDLDRPREPTTSDFVEYQKRVNDIITAEVMLAWKQQSST
jgi:NitT/TauT family transport system ATP-binding protein